MGAELAWKTKIAGVVGLKNFRDRTVLKAHLDPGSWALFGRVVIYNHDGDGQGATARLVVEEKQKDDQEIDVVGSYISEYHENCFSLFGVVKVQLREGATVRLKCNTYDGAAKSGAILAIKTDSVFDGWM